MEGSERFESCCEGGLSQPDNPDEMEAAGPAETSRKARRASLVVQETADLMKDLVQQNLRSSALIDELESLLKSSSALSSLPPPRSASLPQAALDDEPHPQDLETELQVAWSEDSYGFPSAPPTQAASLKAPAPVPATPRAPTSRRNSIAPFMNDPSLSFPTAVQRSSSSFNNGTLTPSTSRRPAARHASFLVPKSAGFSSSSMRGLQQQQQQQQALGSAQPPAPLSPSPPVMPRQASCSYSGGGSGTPARRSLEASRLATSPASHNNNLDMLRLLAAAGNGNNVGAGGGTAAAAAAAAADGSGAAVGSNSALPKRAAPRQPSFTAGPRVSFDTGSSTGRRNSLISLAAPASLSVHSGVPAGLANPTRFQRSSTGCSSRLVSGQMDDGLALLGGATGTGGSSQRLPAIATATSRGSSHGSSGLIVVDQADWFDGGDGNLDGGDEAHAMDDTDGYPFPPAARAVAAVEPPRGRFKQLMSKLFRSKPSNPSSSPPSTSCAQAPAASQPRGFIHSNDDLSLGALTSDPPPAPVQRARHGSQGSLLDAATGGSKHGASGGLMLADAGSGSGSGHGSGSMSPLARSAHSVLMANATPEARSLSMRPVPPTLPSPFIRRSIGDSRAPSLASPLKASGAGGPAPPPGAPPLPLSTPAAAADCMAASAGARRSVSFSIPPGANGASSSSSSSISHNHKRSAQAAHLANPPGGSLAGGWGC